MAMGVARIPDARRAGGVRLFTHAPVTLRWIADRVVPAVRDLRDAGLPTPRLRRGWLGGPHVDIVAGGSPDGGWARLAASLDAGPATAGALDPADYLAQARALGRLEAVPPPYLPMRAHGAVEVLGPRDVTAGSARPLDHAVVESALCGPLIDTIDAVARAPRRAPGLLAEAFVALGDTHRAGLARGAAGFRAYAGGFLDRWGPDEDLRGRFAARLAVERPALRAVVEQRLTGAVTPAAAAWRTAFAAGGAAPTDDPATRLVADLFHRQLPLLTVPRAQRYYMYYAIGELVGDLLGDAWEVEAS